MRIAICDDVAKDRKAIGAMIRDYLSSRNLTAEVAEFPTPERLTAAVARTPFDLYLLDVLLSENTTGIDFARRLRAELSEAPVVFFSTSREYAYEAFSVEAVSYLQKPWTQDAFFRALDRALEAARRVAAGQLVFKVGSDVVRFGASEIEYVETSQTVNYVTINRESGNSITIRGSVKNFAEQYGAQVKLLSAGRSLLVNPKQIASLGSASVRFFSGRTLAIPRSVLPMLAKAVLALSVPPHT